MIWDHPLLLSTLGIAMVGVSYATLNAIWVLRQDQGDEVLAVPYRAIKQGADAFLRTQYGIIFLIGAVLTVLLWWVPEFGPLTAVGFVVGGLASGFSGVLGMWVSVRANVRTAVGAQQGLPQALRIAVRAGSVTGFMVAAFSVALVTAFYLFLLSNGKGQEVDLTPLVGVGFGASLISIFARLGGGIFTKAADVGADLVGKIEQKIPEDDPRNPAVIADNVGDNVGDCAGMSADVFESFAVTLIATILLAAGQLPDWPVAQQFPLLLGGVGIAAGLLGIQAIRVGRRKRVTNALAKGVVLTILAAAGGFFLVTFLSFDAAFPVPRLHLFGSSLIGLLVALILLVTTVYFTSDRYSPVRKIAHASRSGHATNIITGLAVGLKSTAAPTLVLVMGVVAAFSLAGIYGIGIATCSMLALTPIIVTMDAYGPVADNAGGISEMAGLPPATREVTDALDAAGNTTKATTKSFAVASAGLASLVLFQAFVQELGSRHLISFGLDNPYTLSGLYLGALLPFVFCGLILESVGKAASRIVEMVREQFRTYPEILEGKRQPDYAGTVSMLTRASLIGMLKPGLLPVAVPILITLIGVQFGPPLSAAHMMGGLLIGVIICGYMLAISMCVGGAAWDNAKKYIEAGHEGGKGSFAHEAAITGDTVGDPYKDTAGPAINPMCKVINVIALLVAPLLT